MLDGFRRHEASEHYERAIALERVGRVDEAIVEYRRAVDVDPGFAAAYEALGHHYQRLGLLVKARDAFQTVAQLEGDYTAHFNLGYILVELEAHEEALQSFQKCLALTPNDPSALYEVGYVQYALEHFTEALEALRIPQEAYAGDWRVHSLVGACFLGLGQWEQAEKSYRQAMETAALPEEMEEARSGLSTAQRYQEFPVCSAMELKDHAYADAGVVFLGTLGDDGLQIPVRSDPTLTPEEVAVTVHRLRVLVESLGLPLTAVVAVDRISAPLVAAVSRALSLPQKGWSHLRGEDRPLLVLAANRQPGLMEIALEQARGRPLTFILALSGYGENTFLPDLVGVPARGTCTLPWERPGEEEEGDGAGTEALLRVCFNPPPDPTLEAQIRYYVSEHRLLRFLE